MKWTPGRPFALARWAARFTRWGNDPVNRFVDGTYHRVAGGSAYRVRQDLDGTFEIDDGAALPDFRARVADTLPWEPVEALAGRDDRVRRLLESHSTFRPVITPDPFEAVVGLVTAQQVNLTWALETKARLVHAFGTEHPSAYGTVWGFPSAERLATADPGELRAMQLTTRKAEYIVGLAQAAAAGAFAPVPAMGAVEAINHLMAQRGVGRWTAEQLLARCWARPEVAAPGDLGVRKAVSFHWFDSDTLLPEATVRDTTDSWGAAANLLSQLLLEEL